MVGACPFPAPQGSQVLLRTTAEGLRDRGHDVRLVVYGHGAGDDTSGLTVHRAARIPGVRKTAPGPSFAKPFLDAALVAALRRVLREHTCDVVHAHNYEGLLAALAAGKRPIVYHAHNAMADELPYFSPAWLRGAAARFGAWLDRTFPRRADHAIAPHAALAGYLVKCGCADARVTVIAPPVTAAAFAPCRISEDTPPVLYTGNLDRYQNLELLVNAMSRVRAILPEVRLKIATTSPGNIAGAEMVRAASLPQLHALFAEDAVFASPRVSWSGYPMKLLNAMAAGMAIVACHGAAHPLDHEQTGLIVAGDSPEAFAQALLRLLRDPALRTRLGRNARETALRQHDPANTATQIETVYSALLP